MTAPSLPTGAVTFLLTDIEGSTAAWQAGRDGLAEAIQGHYEVLDRRIGEHGGVRPEEQGEGDSVVAVFADPVAAMSAAIEAQLDLVETFPDLPVRMALHTGEANLRNDRNYVGLTIIRCARIRSCGHGRQILVSQATVEAVGERLPAGSSVRALGEYGLKGLAGRTRICQVTGPGLPDAFPPLKAGTTAAGNLPHRVSSFVGRRAELAAVTDLLVDHRLVSLVGPAGVGTSRLALAAAAAVADAHPGGAWWVSVPGAVRSAAGPGSDAEHDAGVAVVAGAVAEACSLERHGAALDDVVAFFGSVAAALLVVDGADAARPAVAALVEQLLASCPETRVIVTGRDPLELGGEAVFRLDPFPPVAATDLASLDRTDAGRLFLDRLRDAGGTLADADVDAVMQICRRWPTPADIEMAAIRSAGTPAAELLAELETLGGAASAALGSSVHWHLRSISEDERTLLTRLAVFRGPVDPDDALAVVAGTGLDTDAATRALDGLTGRRVLRVDAGRLVLDGRLREVVRSWSSAEERAVDTQGHPYVDGHVERYVERFVGVAERFDAAGVTTATGRIAADLDDVLGALAVARDREMPAAYRLAAALGPRWHELDRWEELEATSEWLATRSPTDGELVWVAAVARVSFAAAGIAGAAVHGLHDEATAIAALDHDEASSLFLAYRPAVAALDRGEPGPAEELFRRASSLGIEAVAVAVAIRLLVAAGTPGAAEHAAYVAARADPDAAVAGVATGGIDQRRDPIAAAAARTGAAGRDDGGSEAVRRDDVRGDDGGREKGAR